MATPEMKEEYRKVIDVPYYDMESRLFILKTLLQPYEDVEPRIWIAFGKYYDLAKMLDLKAVDPMTSLVKNLIARFATVLRNDKTMTKKKLAMQLADAKAQVLQPGIAADKTRVAIAFVEAQMKEKPNRLIWQLKEDLIQGIKTFHPDKLKPGASSTLNPSTAAAEYSRATVITSFAFNGVLALLLILAVIFIVIQEKERSQLMWENLNLRVFPT